MEKASWRHSRKSIQCFLLKLLSILTRIGITFLSFSSSFATQGKNGGNLLRVIQCSSFVRFSASSFVSLLIWTNNWRCFGHRRRRFAFCADLRRIRTEAFDHQKWHCRSWHNPSFTGRISNEFPFYNMFCFSFYWGKKVINSLHLQKWKSFARSKVLLSRFIINIIWYSERACVISLLGKEENEDQNREYQLPDGEKIQIGSSKFKAPEILFNPECNKDIKLRFLWTYSVIGSEELGVHDLLYNSIRKSDLDLRKTLYQNIVLSGGSTLFRGIKGSKTY